MSLKSLVRSMYSRFKEDGIYDPEQFDWTSAESFFEQRKGSGIDSSDPYAWRGWSDELDSVSVIIAVFLLDALHFADQTSRPSPTQIFITQLFIYLTSFAFLDCPRSRCINISSVASEF